MKVLERIRIIMMTVMHIKQNWVSTLLGQYKMTSKLTCNRVASEDASTGKLAGNHFLLRIQLKR